jgi:hypothetical protein
MKTNYKLALAVLAGVSIGVAGAKAMHGRQVTPPPAYVISEVDTMDLTGIPKYELFNIAPFIAENPRAQCDTGFAERSKTGVGAALARLLRDPAGAMDERAAERPAEPAAIRGQRVR